MKKTLIFNLCLYILICIPVLFSHFKPDTVVTDTEPSETKLIIMMYHGFTDGEKESEYVIKASRLEDDILTFKEKGFEFIDTDDLIEYSKGSISLPSKTVMLTFDDGYLNNYTYAFPILKKHGVKAVISPIAYYVDFYSARKEKNPLYTQLTYDEIKEMHQSGLIDFQNHSYNMHSLNERKGSSKLSYENTEKYIREFYYDLKAAENVIKDATGKKTRVYAYPFGRISNESLYILKCCGYKMTLSCSEGFNYIRYNSESLYNLKRFNRTPQKSATDILNRY